MATRTRLSQDYWERQLRQWRKSGQTQVQYCDSAGLNKKTFNRWKIRLANVIPGKAGVSPSNDKPASLIPVRIDRKDSSDTGRGCSRDIRIRLDDRHWVVDVPFGVDLKHLANVLIAIAGIQQ